MNFWSKLLNFGRYVPPGNLPPQAAPYAWAWYGQPDVPADLRLTPQQQLSVDTVYACTRIVSQFIGRAPWKVYTRNARGSRIELPDDPAYYLLNVRPNPMVPAVSFREALIIQAIIHGNAYAEIVYDLAGRVKELNIIPSERMVPRLAIGGEPIASNPPRTAQPRELIYQVLAGSEQVGIYLGSEQVFHLRGLATVDGIQGDSVVTRAAKSIATAFAIEKFGLNYYANNTLVGGVVTMPPGKPLTPGEQATFEQQWKTKNSGVRSAFKTLFLGNGATFEVLNHDASQAQVIEARKQSVESIARYFGVPLHMLNLSSTGIQGNGKNLEEHNLTLVRDALKPWAVRLQQEADFKLFAQRAPWRSTEIDLSEFTRGNEMDRASAAKIWIESGIKTINEIREPEGMNHIEGDQADEGDLHLISSGLTVLDEEQLAPQPEPAPEQGDQPAQMGGEQKDGEQEKPAQEMGGMQNVHRLILTKHQDRIAARQAHLQQTLKNGHLAEKMSEARAWSRERAMADLKAAGLDAPAGWQGALDAIEGGGDPEQLAKALSEMRN